MSSQYDSNVVGLVFSIPQVVASISQGLSHHDLTNCVRVNHDWNRIFSFEFLRRDTGRTRIRGAFLIQEGETEMMVASRSLNSKQRMTRQEIMAENCRVNEDMEENKTNWLDENFLSDDEASDSDADGEKQRKVHSTDSSGVRSINDSELCRVLRDRLLPYTFVQLYWLSTHVVPSPRGRNIKLDQVLGLMADTVLALDLRLTDVAARIPLSASLPKRMGRRRDLTSLTLTMETAFEHIGDALDQFLQECPELRRLSLNHTDMEAYTVELSQLMRKNCPKLTEFAFQGQWDLDDMNNVFPPPKSSPTVPDPDTESEVKMAASVDKEDPQQPRQQRGLRAFSFTDAFAFGDTYGLINTLKSHRSTLESIEIDGPRISSQDMERFLTCFPRLEHLSINATDTDVEYVSLLNISSFRPSTPWVCLGLKSICLEIGDGCEYYGDCEDWKQNLHPSDRTPHPDVLSIYQRLSELTALESIQLGFSHGDSTYRRTAKSDLGFDFSLASGLHLLTTLKSLKKLTFFEFEEDGHWMIPDIGQAEVEWMAEHWTGLQEIKLNIQRPEEGSAGAEQWRWLKEARPDINVRFAVNPPPFE